MGSLTPRRTAPVFVVGSPRSGTTLLYHMLLSAGGFAVYRAETNVFNMLVPKFGNLSARKNRDARMKKWLQSEFFQRSGLEAEEIRAKILAECRNGGDFLRILMESIAERQKVDRWAECTPTNLLYMPDIKRSLPDAVFVHMIRDGRDVALSLERQGWIRPFAWDKKRSALVAGLFWEWMVQKGRDNARRVTPDYMEVHYEGLVNQPRETLAKVALFIDHDLDYERIRQVGIGAVSDPNTSFEVDKEDGGFGPVGRWRSRYSSQDLMRLEALI